MLGFCQIGKLISTRHRLQLPTHFLEQPLQHITRTYFTNTMIVCVVAVIGTVVSSSLVAFSFARMRWPGRDYVFALLLITMMLPIVILIVPRFLMFSYYFRWPWPN